ncbi:MAG: hypothetical protein ABWZ98_04390 [Nakamurella sp.]
MSECGLWLAELLLLSGYSRTVRAAQFVIRTVVRAAQLAKKAGTAAIDKTRTISGNQLPAARSAAE